MSTATNTTQRTYVTRTPGVCGGRPCIAGHRIAVDLIAQMYNGGDTPDDIVRSLPTLDLAQVHGAIAFYFDNKSEIDQSIADVDRIIAECRAKTGPGPLEQWMTQRKAERAKLQFHLDENVGLVLAQGLWRRGMNVTPTPPDRPKRTSDAEQLDWCLKNGRVIVSQDTDMLRMSSGGVSHAGVAYFRPRSRTVGELNARLVALSSLLC